jgi:2-polyprenyl-6-methoxyphenol hydroxylase-like FAD-dependent oxidoreductase
MIDDAANLAWKLAATIQGPAGPPLLDSYEDERGPAAERSTQTAIAPGRPLQGIPLSENLEEDTRPASSGPTSMWPGGETNSPTSASCSPG